MRLALSIESWCSYYIVLYTFLVKNRLERDNKLVKQVSGNALRL
jgi:hypothetical protein